MGLRIVLTMGIAACVVCGAASAAEVTFESLVKEMTDLEQLTRFPDPAYTCKQFSSYDRRTTDPNVLTDENWFANGDRGQHIRKEYRKDKAEWVMMDAEGPGAIVRIWSANPKDGGFIRIYIDGAEEPAVDVLMSQALGGGPSPFIRPISGERSRGWNCYLPIPYAKHCKVTASMPDFYYQVNYRTYAPGTAVESYSQALAEQHKALIETTAKRLADPALFTPPAGSESQLCAATIAPGESYSSLFEKSGAIYSTTMNVEAGNVEEALRGCLLEMFFDGETVPSVSAPLGDFFGMAPGLNPYASLPSGVLADGTMYSHWVEPFQKSHEMRITNHTGQPVVVSGESIYGSYTWTDRSMYFHAKWRSEYPLPTQPRRDWNYVKAQGKGMYVGDMLHITNPVKDWWGEGDEKIYVDGESFPSHIGTGSEDYYGYAWCCNEPFTHAYHNQPRCDGPGNYGQTCVNRWHIIDNIPYTTSFQFDIEAWHWAECEIAMAATAYWYATPGGTDNFVKPAPEQLVVVTPPPLPEPKRIEGALEGEELAQRSHSGGTVEVQEAVISSWSAGKQLWWRDAKPGDKLVLAFPVEKAGKYEVFAVFTKAVDYGIVQFRIDGQPAGAPMDFYNNGVIATPEVSLGAFDLTAGENTLEAEITGKNEKAVPAHMLGLDYIRIGTK